MITGIKYNIIHFRVGKSSILYRYCEEQFPESYKPTIGTDLFTTKININDSEYNLQVIDPYLFLFPRYGILLVQNNIVVLQHPIFEEVMDV